MENDEDPVSDEGNVALFNHSANIEEGLMQACNKAFGNKSFDEQVEEAIRNSDDYTVEQLSYLRALHRIKKDKEKKERRDEKLRAKVIKDLRKEYDNTYIPNWKAFLWVLEEKIKKGASKLKDKTKKGE